MMDANLADQQRRRTRGLTARGLLWAAVSVALGVTLGVIGLGERLPESFYPTNRHLTLLTTGRDWYIAALATISLWVVLGTFGPGTRHRREAACRRSVSCRGPLGPAVRIYHLASIGAAFVPVCCILLWQLAVRWLTARQRAVVGVLLAASLATLYGFTARICLVEVPSISPIMAAYIFRPSPLCLAAGVVLTAMLTAAVARRWSEPPRSEFAPEIGNWRRDSWRYYHERRGLVLLLGVVAPANYLVSLYAVNMYFQPWFSSWHFSVSQWVSSLCSLYFPTSFLSLVLVLLAVQVAFFRRPASRDAVATAPPRLTPCAAADRLALVNDDRRL